jgi:hypothetical protein
MTPPNLAIASALALASALASAPSFAAAPSAPAGGAPLSVAVVVGSNHSPSAALQDLRYGDDDAVQNARTLALLGAETTLLVVPDAETRELFPNTKPQGPATRAALRAAFDAAKAKVTAARAAGRPTDLYFLFAGHGDTADGRPFLQLDDAKLWREDLAEMLRGAGADANHVVVDACFASAFVSDRGPGGERDRLPPGFSRGTKAVWPERTGFLTARSAGGQTHEWAEYQAGVFSHELRSGLMGAADVDVDGKVTYREIAAFVRRANEAIPNRRYRPELSTTPPGGNLDAALAMLPSGPIVLEMDLQPGGRAFVETETGIRLADLHPAPGAAVKLRLPTDLGGLFVAQEGTPNVAGSVREFKLPARAGHVRMSALATEASHVSARGAGHEAFMHLFARPFDLGAASSFNLEAEDAAELKWIKHEEDAARAHTLRRKVAMGAFGVGAATGAISLGFLLRSLSVDGATASQADIYTRGLDRDRSAIFAGVAGGALLTGAILWLWPDAPNVSVASAPGCEACVGYQRRF